jgi:hypothetical protein
MHGANGPNDIMLLNLLIKIVDYGFGGLIILTQIS